MWCQAIWHAIHQSDSGRARFYEEDIQAQHLRLRGLVPCSYQVGLYLTYQSSTHPSDIELLGSSLSEDVEEVACRSSAIST